MSNIIDFNKGKRLIAKKKSEKERMIARAKEVIESRPRLPEQRSFEDYTFDEKVEAFLKNRWSLDVYIQETSWARDNNRWKSYRPDWFPDTEIQKIIPYDKWVIKKLSQLYPDEAKSAKVVAITSD